jgi:hypothetical protein
LLLKRPCSNLKKKKKEKKEKKEKTALVFVKETGEWLQLGDAGLLDV